MFGLGNKTGIDAPNEATGYMGYGAEPGIMRDREKEKSMSYIKNADIQGNAWVAPGACVVGNVTLGDESSVWYNAVLRGDMAPIVVGCGSNVQDGTVVHADNGFPCKIGNGTSIGHNAIIHGCTIGNNTER